MTDIPTPADAARIALACLDLTSLNDDDTPESISALCQRALAAPGTVAALCVWPRFVAQTRAALPPSIRVAAVANFPDGSLDADRAVAETESILAAGGNEVDLVLSYPAFKGGNVRECAALVAAVRAASTGHTLKLIIESGELVDPKLIADASQLGLDEGVDFLKTSTGKSPVSATPEAARVMLEAIAKHRRNAEVGFKASGGIRKVADAAAYIALTQEILGHGAVTPARLRFGASGLLTDIENVLSGTTGTASTSAY